LELLAAQLGEAMDNARLYQSIQRQAVREQMLAGLTARMRETLDVDTVLRTAANEIFQALALEEVSIELAEDEPVLAGMD
jgi:GAF domain-containing protein